MSSQEITFFDLPTRPPTKPWSLNPWKIRLYLNYKQIPYKTEWIEYPDIKPRLSPHVEPNPETSFAPYTVPTVILPDGTYIMESVNIAKRLEEMFPSPPLKIETEYFTKVTDLVGKVMKPAAPEYMWNIPQRLLNEKSATWWYPDRERRVGGIKLDVFKKEQGGKQISEATAPVIKEAAELLRQNPGGPFFEGEQVTFADFVWAAVLKFFQTIGQDTFDLVVCEEREPHLKLLEACAPWFERDDH